jgi:hypothetical protein
VQLFLVPGLIVAVAVLILLGFKAIVGGGKTPEEYLKSLGDSNPEVRWRAASDLAQVLQRPESLKLASDPRFGLTLAERLQEALEDLDKSEKEQVREVAADKTGKKTERTAWQALAPRRNQVIFLIACLGNLTTPVGAVELGEVAGTDPGAEQPRIPYLRKAMLRRLAVLALAKLGNNLGRFQTLPAEDRLEVIVTLKEEARGTGKRAEWAGRSLKYLLEQQSRGKEKLSAADAYTLSDLGGVRPLGVDQTLARCARADDPFLRKLVAFALKYWDGPEVEKTLIRLSHDSGEGTIIDVDELDREPGREKP